MTTKKTSKTKKVDLPETYEAALEELETLVGKIEGGQMPLDELLGSYERGADLLNFCKSKLETLEQQIHVLENDKLKAWQEEA